MRPYEILSLAPQAGLVQMVKNATTIDALKRQLHENFKEVQGLHNFFRIFYQENLKKAQEKFCASLAAYSLVCYFLQIKDRHNGNILLHKDGYILHIDFGFFLSNAPGRSNFLIIMITLKKKIFFCFLLNCVGGGLEFEGNVPFKLLSEYIEILGGVDSKIFNEYRRLFYK